MAKLTITQEDGSTQDFFDQAHVDQAVADAIAALPAQSTIKEVDVIEEDGSVEKFSPEA